MPPTTAADIEPLLEANSAPTATTATTATTAPTATIPTIPTTPRKTLYTLGALSLLPLLLLLYSNFSPPPRPVMVSTPTLLGIDAEGGLPAVGVMGRDPDDYVLDPEWDVHAPPTTRYYNLTLTEAAGSPDGVLRTFLLLNSQFPAPLIRANTDDTLHITLHNRSPNSTSLHWHGQHQRGTPWMDGTVGVTSCPVPPGASFTYVFTVTRTAGTFWYHAHFSTSRIDGVFGPLVIHARGGGEPAVSSDRVLMVHDYYHDLSPALLHDYLAPGNENAEPVPDGALINGRGRVDCRAVAPGRVCNESWGGGMQYVGVETGGVHRLRFINVGAFAEFDIEIDDHEWALPYPVPWPPGTNDR